MGGVNSFTIFFVTRYLLTIAVVMMVLAPAATGEQISFQQAVDLAIRNAKTVSIARDDAQRVRKAYLEVRDAYIPQVTLGSGAAYTFGFPLGTPSVFNITSYSLLYNPAQREYLRAATFEINASDLFLRDKRQQVILDTAVAYADLDRHLTALALLKSEEESASRALGIAQQRIQAGIEPAIEETRAKLTFARVRLKRSQVDSEADLLRLRLSQLTGVPALGLATVSDSMPAMPALPEAADTTKLADDSLSARAAQDDAIAKDHTAHGERKQLYPQINLIGQYALFSNAINNYSQYYKNFQRNNGLFGVEIKIPVLNFSQRAKYQEAAAEAHKAHDQAEDTRDLIAADILRLQRAAQQLAQAEEVSQLELQLAQSDTATSRARNESGQASPKDLENAQLAEVDKHAAMLDARFNYQQARLQLMRLTGEIEGWAKSGGSPAP